MKVTSLVILTSCTILGATLSSQAWANVAYQIDLTTPQHHTATVKVTFPKSQSNKLVVNLPVWRTGRYQVLPISDGIRLFSATDSKGKPLTWQRTASGEWQVDLKTPTEVSVSYQVHADQLMERLRHIDSSHAFLDASGVFMYSPEFRQEPITVNMDVPAAWKSHSGMDKGSNAHSFKAPNYDVLLDSPIETGINQHFSFKADNREYEVVFWGEGNYDTKQILTDLKKFSAEAKTYWDDYPFERYVYMVHATNGVSGATEHLNSTVIQLPRFSFRERADYLRFISTASHEFIHTWNIKSYRPQELASYNYQAENMTDLLWIAEGSTSYFHHQILLRAGVITPAEFFEDLSTRIALNEQTPGREIQSIAEASLGQWSSTYGDYAINHSVNIYSEGYFTSLSLDFALLADSKLAHSYRDVHRALYRDFKLPKGYTVADVQGILTQLTGKDYLQWWQENVNQPIVFDFDAMLAQAGLTKGYEKQETEVDAGFTLTGLNEDLTLTAVLKNGPAWKAGINAGDEIVAINGLKVTAAGLTKRLADFKAGDSIKISLFNNDSLKEVSLTLAEKPKGKLIIRGVTNPTSQQKAFLKAWAGIDWPFDEKGEFVKVK